MVDPMGFCGRFFTEAIEEVDYGHQEALAALGATQVGRIFCAVIPGAFPLLINSVLFSLEKATRSSVILGLVGAGGIGIELKSLYCLTCLMRMTFWLCARLESHLH